MHIENSVLTFDIKVEQNCIQDLYREKSNELICIFKKVGVENLYLFQERDVYTVYMAGTIVV